MSATIRNLMRTLSEHLSKVNQTNLEGNLNSVAAIRAIRDRQVVFLESKTFLERRWGSNLRPQLGKLPALVNGPSFVFHPGRK